MTAKFAFIFPGQGSQYVGMGKTIAATAPEAAQIFAQADKTLETNLSALCWRGPEEALNDTYNTQPALFVTSIALLEALRGAGFSQKPDFVAGHSLGEYSAYVAAGALSFDEGLKLVRERGRLMKKAGEESPGKMAAILALDEDKLEAICQEISAEVGLLQIANYNAPGQIVISGIEAAIDQAMEQAKEAGARRTIKLNVSIAAHSQLMGLIRTEFASAINQTSLAAPTIPVIGNITARPLTTPEALHNEMVEQLVSSVQWTQSINYMIEQGVTHFIEIGAKDVLTGLMKRINRKVKAISVEDMQGVDAVIEELN